jgi:hypothetical protein
MKHAVPMLTDTDMRHLRRCVELATDALEAGDEPFGSVLVGADGTVLGEDHNHVAGGDRTRHPERLAAWLSELGVPAPPVRTLPIQAISFPTRWWGARSTGSPNRFTSCTGASSPEAVYARQWTRSASPGARSCHAALVSRNRRHATLTAPAVISGDQ